MQLQEESRTFHFKTTLAYTAFGRSSTDANCLVIPNGIHIHDGQAMLTWKAQSSMDADLRLWLIGGNNTNPLAEGFSADFAPCQLDLAISGRT